MQKLNLSPEWTVIQVPKNYKPNLVRGKMLRVLIDENISVTFTKLFKSVMPFSVTTVSELRMSGSSDEILRDFARRRQFVLLTTDKDFLNERKHPIRKCHGIFCFECGPQELIKMVENFPTFYNYFLKGSTNDYWAAKKVLIKTDGFIVHIWNETTTSFEVRIDGSKALMRKIN